MPLAVIGTFYGRHERTFALMHRLFCDGTRQPDEAWLMCETDEDADRIYEALAELHALTGVDANPNVVVLPTPCENGTYLEIPYSRKINHALDQTDCDLIVYLDNGSMPSAYKYQVMAEALEANPSWGAVYCTQKRTGYLDATFVADKIVENAHGQLNYTQVMHRHTPDRWTTNMEFANPDMADAMFWTDLHKSLGPFHPAGGSFIHDDHHMPGPHAAGV